VVEDPTDHQPTDALDAYRIEAGLTHGELWLRYFELGGMSTEIEVEAILYGALDPSAHDHEVIVLALNERFIEIGSVRTVPYRNDRVDPPRGDPGEE
jgi:hypothetical protein